MESGQLCLNTMLPAKFQELKILIKQRNQTLASETAKRQETASQQQQRGRLRDWCRGWSCCNAAGNVVGAYRAPVRGKLSEKARGVDPKRAAGSDDGRSSISKTSNASWSNGRVIASRAKQLQHKGISVRTCKHETEKSPVVSRKEVHDSTLTRQAKTRSGNVRVIKGHGNIRTHTAADHAGAERARIYRKGKSKRVANIR